MNLHLSDSNNEGVKKYQKANPSFMAHASEESPLTSSTPSGSFSEAFEAAEVDVTPLGAKSSGNPITELNFENSIADFLTDKTNNAYALELYKDVAYNREYAVEAQSLFKYLYDNYKDDMEFIFSTGDFKKLESDAEKELLFISKLWEARKTYGLINVMRYGFDIASTNIKLFKEQDALNKNFTSLIRQVHFELEPPANKSVDIVLFINGLPFAVIELKNNMTGQSRKDAEAQFIRRSNKEPLFVPNAGALTFFAVDENTASVATSIVGNQTVFIPFKPSFENPRLANFPKEDEYGNQTYYLWHRFWNKKGIINLVSNYLYQTTATLDSSEAKIIMPRYHQCDVVDSIVENPHNHIGKSTLIQHSAGSGKTKTIAWLSSSLRKMVDKNGDKVFDTIIIVANRAAIIKQLADAVYEYDRTLNLKDIEAAKTQELHKIIESSQSDIVATTIQKFGVLAKTIEEITSKKPNAKYAIIVDEAHSGTSGEHGANIRQLGSKADDGIEDELAKIKKAVEKITSLSFFAFTATPKTDTLMVYGEVVYDAFTMKEAINNKLILNTITNYATYNMMPKAYLDGEDKTLKDKAKALADLKKDVMKNPEVLKEKVEVTLRHMTETVIPMLEGQGKGIVVANDIRMAMLWYKTIKTFTKNGKYTAVKPLIAFSGKAYDYINTSDSEAKPSQEVTEEKVNGFKEHELPSKFNSEEYNLLIVVDKYQVGFDQPKLCAMYLDKKVKDVNAIQTLSRLNRVFPNKEEVYVIDFANNEKNVEEAFNKYSIAFEPKDAKVKYILSDLERIANVILETEILTIQEVKAFHRAWNGDKNLPANQKILKNVIRSVQEKLEELLESDILRIDTFFSNLNKYVEAYNYLIVTSNISINNPALEAMHQIARILKYQEPKGTQLNKDWLSEVAIEIPDIELVFKELNTEGDERSEESNSSTTTNVSKDGEEATIEKTEEPQEALASEVIDEYNKSLSEDTLYKRFDEVESDEIESYDYDEIVEVEPNDNATVLASEETVSAIKENNLFKKSNRGKKVALAVALPISVSMIGYIALMALGIL